MKQILLIAFIFLFIKVDAQNMVVSFSSTKPDEKIDSVLVENFNQSKSIVLRGTTNLELTSSPVTSSPIYGASSSIKVYPNPATDKCFLKFRNNESGNVTVGLYDLTGKQIIGRAEFLEQGIHEFQLSGLPSGISVIKIAGLNFSYNGKIVSRCNGVANLDLNYFGVSDNEEIPTQFKSLTTNTLMRYNKGDRLKYTMFSNGNITVQTDVPTQNKKVSATFYEAKDADGNSYATVTIGTQTWMAENLRTTKYNDGTAIPIVTDPAIWVRYYAPAYCWYNNDISNKNIYGALYKWDTVETGNLAPTGWHVPTDDEWTTFENYVDAGEYTTYGSIAKALASTTNWALYTIGTDFKNNNSTGFTAQPSGRRYADGDFYDINSTANWWSSTQKGGGDADYRLLGCSHFYLCSDRMDRRCGFSVRLIKD